MFPHAHFKTVLEKAEFLMVFQVIYNFTCMPLSQKYS